MIRILSAVAVSALLLAACGQPASEPAAAPETPAATEPAAPTTPVADNVLTAEGLGAVRIGMTKAEVTQAWGDIAPNTVGGAEPAVCEEYHPVNAPAGVNVLIENGRLARITLIRDATFKTDRGFGVGDTAAAIKTAYGTALIAQPHKYSPAPAEDLFAWSVGAPQGEAYVQDPAARGVRYEINGEGRVGMVHAGGPAIQLVEGCS